MPYYQMSLIPQRLMRTTKALTLHHASTFGSVQPAPHPGASFFVSRALGPISVSALQSLLSLKTRSFAGAVGKVSNELGSGRALNVRKSSSSLSWL